MVTIFRVHLLVFFQQRSRKGCEMAITNSAKANELKRKIARLQEVEFDRSGPFIYTSFDPFEREKCKERDKFYADKQKRVEVLEAELNELKGKIAERQSVHR